MNTYSAVDSIFGKPYLISMLYTPVHSDLLITSHQSKIPPAVLAARNKAAAARKQGYYETGKRIFEKLKGRCNTKEFSMFLKDKSGGAKLLSRMEEFGWVICAKRGIGTKPSVWEWKG